MKAVIKICAFVIMFCGGVFMTGPVLLMLAPEKNSNTVFGIIMSGMIFAILFAGLTSIINRQDELEAKIDQLLNQESEDSTK